AELPMSVTQAFAWAREQWPVAREHWHRVLDGAPPALTAVPGRKPTEHYTAHSVPIGLSREVADRLRALARRHGATTFMAVLAAWSEVLASWAAAPEVVLLSPVPGRTRPELEDLLGCFVQPLLLRIDLRGAPELPELLARARSTVLTA